MDKNLLLAVTLSIAVYAAWFGLIEKRIAVKPTIPVTSAIPAPSGAGAPERSSQPSMSSPEQTQQAQAEVVAKAYPAAFGTANALIGRSGAAIVSFKEQEPLGVVELVEDARGGLLSTFGDLKFSEVAGAERPTFEARKGGLKIVKEFRPGTDAVLPELIVKITNDSSQPVDTGAWALTLGPGLGTIANEQKDNKKYERAIGLTQAEGGGLAGKVEAFKPGETRDNRFQWLGIDNKYFLAAAIPKPEDFPTAASPEKNELQLVAKNETLAPGQERDYEVPYFIGAKSQTKLPAYGAHLERAIDLGIFAWFGRKIVWGLFKLYGVTHNWGWSIVTITILIQVLLLPLTYKSLQATMAMKRLQPEIAKLQQRYGKDPQRLNTEMMDLYKKHGANPIGGCLPMLLQAPIIYALYQVLRVSWELHGSGWIFWIKDLSAKDPFYILPLVMGGLMFLQNRINPPSADPSQQQMMMFMPVIFTVMFMNFPSGLVLYWLTNSLVSTVQQLALKGHFERRAPRR